MPFLHAGGAVSLVVILQLSNIYVVGRVETPSDLVNFGLSRATLRQNKMLSAYY